MQLCADVRGVRHTEFMGQGCVKHTVQGLGTCKARVKAVECTEFRSQWFIMHRVQGVRDV